MGRKAVSTATDRALGAKPLLATVSPIRKQDDPFHLLSRIFPAMRDGALERLVESIRAEGQHEPIVMLDGLVLDGRNRYLACEQLGVQPLLRAFGSRPEDGGDPQGFVIAENIHRRHLTETQRALIASRLAQMPVGRPGNSENFRNLTQLEAAAALGVSDRSVQHAKKAEDALKDHPALMEYLEAGEITASKLSSLADRDDLAEVSKRVEALVAEGEKPKAALKSVLIELHDGSGVSQTSGRGKPAWLMQALVRHYSRHGHTVCDPVAGYGSTLRAARAEDRLAIGAELVAEVATTADDPDIRTGDYRVALADVNVVDAVICDPPYGSRTHSSEQTRSDWSSAAGLAPTYAEWTADDVNQFVDHWSPRCSGWIVALTDSDLAGVWRDAFDRVGRTSFAPIPCVIRGMGVRMTGDGPASWTIYAMVARTKDQIDWGSLPGAYVGTKSRELWGPDEDTDVEEAADGV
ncbi:MAG: hypothetical protein H0X39_01025 [Actinobacteria bacterium]|nr:hypothetical protein [Actinomycetota bacterium]